MATSELFINAFQKLPSSHSLKRVPWEWFCPCCKRNVFECIRLNSEGAVATSICKHRVSNQLICVDCINVQSNIKTQGFQGDWQLDISDIATLINAQPHQKHKVDFAKIPKVIASVNTITLTKGKTKRSIRAERIPDSSSWRSSVINMSRSLDKLTEEDWRCPSCNRSKFETVMWFEQSRDGKIQEGFRFCLVKHHDHGQSKIDVIDGRFPVTIICKSCNDAEGRIKTRFKSLENNWSLSPQELGSILTVSNHNAPRVDFEKAKVIVSKILQIPIAQIS